MKVATQSSRKMVLNLCFWRKILLALSFLIIWKTRLMLLSLFKVNHIDCRASVLKHRLFLPSLPFMTVVGHPLMILCMVKSFFVQRWISASCKPFYFVLNASNPPAKEFAGLFFH